MEESRQNPDELLKVISKEEQNQSRGHLKIFFGYAAGVGKTYAMLKAAHAAKKHGTDVVAGYIEPHARPKTAALLKGLEVLPVLQVKYNGIMLREFDLDAAIARKPQLLLVDELAHTNAEGCRHVKRYQDIEELLKAGIDVYTTVNVQHIESLNDMVASITGVFVRERIPDSVFDEADQVELVDIEPEELIVRLSNGNVYKETQARRAVENFFTVENLTGLREIALRRCADRVNILTENARIKSHGDYHTDEHILVCLSSSPSNAKIIRTAARMAGAFRGAFTALFVETPDFTDMGEENQKRLRLNIRLAEQLGAKIEMVYGEDVPFQIAEFARLSGVSKIVIGRNSAARKHVFSKPTLVEKLILEAPNLDVYIIPDSVSSVSAYRAKREKRKNCIVFSAAVIVLIFSLLFIEPEFTPQAYGKGYSVTFVVMLLTVFLTGSFAIRLKKQAKQSAQTACRTKVLFDTNQLLQQAKSRNEIIAVTSGQLIKLLGRDIVFYPAENELAGEPYIFPAENELAGEPYIFSAAGGSLDESCISENEKAVAEWVFKNNKHAGATTETLSNAKCLYLAVRVNSNVYGVVGIVMNGQPFDAFEKSILLSILGECALAMENEKNAREKEVAVWTKNEQLRGNPPAGNRDR